MGKPQLLAAAAFALAVAAILLFVRRTPVPRTLYDDLRDSAYVALPPALADSLRRATVRLAESPDAENPEAHRALADRWARLDRPALAAEHRRLALEASDPESVPAQAWGESGSAFLDLAERATDESIRMDYAFRAMYAFEKARSLDSGLADVNVGLATVYTDYRGEVMRGVMILREVAGRHPDHVEAWMRLGRFSMMSGQTGRAVERFRHVIERDSLNLQARILLAESLAASGDPEGGRRVIAKGLTLFDDSTSRAALRTSLAQIP